MQEIFPAVLHLRVNRAHVTRLAGTLRGSQFRLKITVEPLRLNHLTVGSRGQIRQPQVNPDFAGSCRWFGIGSVTGEVHIPPPTGILTEGPGFHFTRNRTGEPEPNLPSGV